MDDSNGTSISSLDDARVAAIERRIDRFETITTEALKDILVEVRLVRAEQRDLRDELDQFGRDLISTRAKVADVDSTAMKRRKPGRK